MESVSFQLCDTELANLVFVHVQVHICISVHVYMYIHVHVHAYGDQKLALSVLLQHCPFFSFEAEPLDWHGTCQVYPGLARL